MAVKGYVGAILLAALTAATANAQEKEQGWGNGVVLDVVEINLSEMEWYQMSGSEAILACIERFIDLTYKYMYFSAVMNQPEQTKGALHIGTRRVLVGVMGYPERNHCIVSQIMFGSRMFVMIAAKAVGDVPITEAMPMRRISYEKYNSTRRVNVVDFVQEQYVYGMGIQRKDR